MQQAIRFYLPTGQSRTVEHAVSCYVASEREGVETALRSTHQYGIHTYGTAGDGVKFTQKIQSATAGSKKLVRPCVIIQKSEIHVHSTTSRASAYGFPIFDTMFLSNLMRDQSYQFILRNETKLVIASADDTEIALK